MEQEEILCPMCGVPTIDGICPRCGESLEALEQARKQKELEDEDDLYDRRERR